MEAPDRSEAIKHYEEHRTWLNLADGDAVKVVFIGQSHVRDTIWTGSHRETFDPNNPKHVGQNVHSRETFNCVLKHPDGKVQMRVFENSKSFWDMAATRWKKFGVNRWYELERCGEGTKTRYTLDPMEEITSEEMQQIDTLEKVDLKELYRKREEEKGEETPF